MPITAPFDTKVGFDKAANINIIAALQRPLADYVQMDKSGNENKENINQAIYDLAKHRPIKEMQNFCNFNKSLVQLPFENYKMLDWKWNVDKRSSEVSSDGKWICLNRNSSLLNQCRFVTSAARGNRAFTHNAYTYWEIELYKHELNAISLMIGIGELETSLSENGYLNLLGSNALSYGLSNHGQIWHNNQTAQYCPSFECLLLPDKELLRIGCLLDAYKGELIYFINDKYMGVAFYNIPTQERHFYPIISSTLRDSVMRVSWAVQSFATLKELCRKQIKDSLLSVNTFETILLPKSIQDYLKC